MIINALYRNHLSQVAERGASVLLRDVVDDCPDDEPDGDTAEIRRMIELSGMISLECGLLDDE